MDRLHFSLTGSRPAVGLAVSALSVASAGIGRSGTQAGMPIPRRSALDWSPELRSERRRQGPTIILTITPTILSRPAAITPIRLATEMSETGEARASPDLERNFK